MQQNLISMKISPSDLSEINSAIAVLKSKLLPCLKSLGTDDKAELPKMGDKTVAFVQKALEHCTQNPDLAPKFLDVNEFSNDVNAVAELRSFYAPLLQITDSLSDSMTLAGSDAFAASLVFYNSVKGAQKNNEAKAKTIFEDLSNRFPGRQKSRTQSAKA